MVTRYLQLLARTQAVGARAKSRRMFNDDASYYAGKSVAILPVLHAGAIVSVLDLSLGRNGILIVLVSVLVAFAVATALSVLFDRALVNQALDELTSLSEDQLAALRVRSRVFVIGSWVTFIVCVVAVGTFKVR